MSFSDEDIVKATMKEIDRNIISTGSSHKALIAAGVSTLLSIVNFNTNDKNNSAMGSMMLL